MADTVDMNTVHADASHLIQLLDTVIDVLMDAEHSDRGDLSHCVNKAFSLVTIAHDRMKLLDKVIEAAAQPNKQEKA